MEAKILFVKSQGQEHPKGQQETKNKVNNINRQEHALLKCLEVNLKFTFQDSCHKEWALQKQFALGTQQSQPSDSNVSKSRGSTLKAPFITSFSSFMTLTAPTQPDIRHQHNQISDSNLIYSQSTRQEALNVCPFWLKVQLESKAHRIYACLC